MKKVVLLGDSIRLIGYGLKVPEFLGKDYSVYQSEDNGRFTQYTLRMLFEDAQNIQGADVIHWNNGHWDLCYLFGDGKSFTPIDVYEGNIARIAELLKKITPKVIFATTTPVKDGYWHQNNAVIEKYNAAAIKALKNTGVVINDLYSAVVKNVEENIGEDKIHLSDKGIDLCAKLVADKIKQTVME